MFYPKNWIQFCDQPLDAYLDQFYEEALSVIETYPEAAQEFVGAVIRSRRLNSYHELAGIERAMKWMDERLSYRLRLKETTTRYLPAVVRNIDGLEDDFMRFFPALKAFVEGLLDQSAFCATRC